MFWIILSVLYVWLFSASIFIASIGPPIVMAMIVNTNNSISLADLTKSFLYYAQEGSNKLNVKYDYFLYSLIIAVILFIPTLIVGAFVLRRKLWARNALIGLLIVFILYPIILTVITSGFSTNIFSINMLVFLSIIFLLTRKNIESIFT